MAERTIHMPKRFTGVSPLNFVLLVALGGVILTSMGKVAPSPQQLADGVPDMTRLVGRMLPPNTDPDFLARIARRILETFQIALVGALIGIVLSLPIAWFAARSVSPLGRGNLLAKAFVSFLRTVPDLVWALLFVASIGLGAVAGTMTIVVDTIGFCGRFFAEAMEDAEKEPQEALSAIGAGRGSILVGAILPDIMPSLVNSSLFALEKAVRSSVVLGLVGAGGIGQELKVAFDLFQYRNASMIILTIFVIVFLMEVCTDKLRARIQ
ncbi:Phosphate-import permease protein PhnE [Thalassovita gelatinovora]|uniref:Phosphate-import permease protein PhnE n=1 Tax=Thalassovita gelatinovora TaxID=53501 RepID=A0A0N7LV69_THAGE|nr:phosphonate ABC transporter, permease protein PhnE [Thalassovita gelatinovora]QIZ80060.1 phosphonate ABC transporter, permease protein PhnE [Thalassovita gelatinovora]CUH65466.1 Phosphate-import permease protein PhnE [Thalassovita gelatinovora]SER09237.1 phosphonate transport system permease protein [Thalassovita gelatinovora]